jgi:thymidylate synthase (FAD)
MPRRVEIGIFNIARTMVDREAVDQWMKYLGANEFVVPDTITDPALVIALAAKRCYMSFELDSANISKVRKDYTDYFDNILTSRHGSVLEHAVYTFAIRA